MISLRLSKRYELEISDQMDRQEHTRNFFVHTGLETHLNYFSNPKTFQLSIEDRQGELCGYIILVAEKGYDSVEFRRILIDQNQRGIGQATIAEMESYCINQFGYYHCTLRRLEGSMRLTAAFILLWLFCGCG